MSLTIYHNSRCSKSRETLKLIEAAGEDVETIYYLETPLTELEIAKLQSKLRFRSPRQMMRTGEAIYRELGLKNIDNQAALIKAMAAHPKLIERPIVVKGDRAVLGRPPENVLKLLKL